MWDVHCSACGMYTAVHEGCTLQCMRGVHCSACGGVHGGASGGVRGGVHCSRCRR